MTSDTHHALNLSRTHFQTIWCRQLPPQKELPFLERSSTSANFCRLRSSTFLSSDKNLSFFLYSSSCLFVFFFPIHVTNSKEEICSFLRPNTDFSRTETFGQQRVYNCLDKFLCSFEIFSKNKGIFKPFPLSCIRLTLATFCTEESPMPNNTPDTICCPISV